MPGDRGSGLETVTQKALGSKTRLGEGPVPEGHKKSLLFYSEMVFSFKKLPCWSLFSEQTWHWGVPGNLLTDHFQEERGGSTKGPDSQAH